MTAAGRSAPGTLDAAMGDPWDPHAPLSFAEVLAADERGELPEHGERLLAEHGYLAEFVPAGLGGRLTALDGLVCTGRSVFRRDAALGLAYTASLIGATNVWTAGPARHRRYTADLLLSGQKLAIAYTELGHGNDFARGGLEARPSPPGRLLLTGRKELVTNFDTAAAIVLLARTGPDGGARSQSLLLLEAGALDPRHFRHLPRFGTAGMRGLRLGGIEFEECPVEEDALLGERGKALEVALRAFQVTRTAVAGMCLGMAETGLRTAVRFTGSRQLFGQSVSAMPHVGDVLATAFLDLLICDCLATGVARALHLAPDGASVYAAAAKYFVPSRITAAMNRLSGVMGAQFYTRQGEYGIFQKMLRDIAPATFAHSAPAVCLSTVLPQLPRLARRSFAAAAPPAALFRLGAALPPLSFADLTVAASSDVLTAALGYAAGEVRLLGDPVLTGLARVLEEELAALRDEILGLSPAQLSMGSGALDIAARYSVLLAASSCLNIWLASADTAHGFLGGTGWLAAALARLTGLLGRGPVTLTPEASELLHTELRRRCDGGGSLELARMAAGD